MSRLLIFVAAFSVLVLGGCASLGDTPAEKRQAIIDMREDTLTTLFRDEPQARAQIEAAAGYGVFDGASQNLIVLQTSGGYGVLTDRSGATTFMRVGGAGVGFGIGLKGYREVVIFRNSADFQRFRDTGWDAGGQAEASLTSGRRGGSLAGSQSIDLDIITYQIVDAGAALQATVGASKYWRWRELNN
jgi:lipid-binding SYLF domain-containing protein